MKKKLIILSDLWGKEKSDWIKNYTKDLKNDFEIKYYDCCELGAVDKSIYTQEMLHKQFMKGGIDKSVQKLMELEKDNATILAFSIGGVIAWKYGVESDKIDALYCVSSTRLRYETFKPNGEIKLYYGEKDDFKPKDEWFTRMKLSYDILKDKEHQFYIEPEFAKQLSSYILEKSKNDSTTMNVKS